LFLWGFFFWFFGGGWGCSRPLVEKGKRWPFFLRSFFFSHYKVPPFSSCTPSGLCDREEKIRLTSFSLPLIFLSSIEGSSLLAIAEHSASLVLLQF